MSCAVVLRFNQFSMLIGKSSPIFCFSFFSSNAELDSDWVVLLSSEPRAESEKVKKEERLGLRAERGLTFSSLGLPPLFLAASPLVPLKCSRTRIYWILKKRLLAV